MKRNKKGQFIKGSNGNTYQGFGIWYDKKGYPSIWIDGKIIKLHVYVWEKKHGNKPKGYQLHHRDGDKRNYHLQNLELLTQSEHSRIHAGWIRKDGKWILKPCKDCKQLLSLDKFYQRRGLTPCHYCIECAKKRFKKRNTTKYRKYRKKYMKNYYKKNREILLKKQKEQYCLKGGDALCPNN